MSYCSRSCRRQFTVGPYWTSKVEDLVAFAAIVSNIWIIPTKFEEDMTIRCRVIAFLSADTSRDLVTLIFDLLTLSSCHTWRVT